MTLQTYEHRDFLCPEINESVTITIRFSELHPAKRVPTLFECENNYNCPLTERKGRSIYPPVEKCHFYKIFESMRKRK